MSWNFWLEVYVGGQQTFALRDFEDEYTYNVAPMFNEAFLPNAGGIRRLDGLVCEECLKRLDLAIAKMRDDSEFYKAMNPENGYGNYDGALELLTTLRDWCLAAPQAVLRVS